ncbi:hypothetical protein WH240_04955 [Gluconobacter wancherniae]|uniref:hypothetical protein n=1 Tax=Gluconobacter wancherniae TaxID=1307955 RepID=UPI0030A85A99
MFSVFDMQTSQTTSNLTVEDVADYLTGKGALIEKDTHEYGAGLVFENKEWRDTYSVKYAGKEDIEQAYAELRTALK